MLLFAVILLVTIAILSKLMDWKFFWDIFKWGLLVTVALFIIGVLMLLLGFLGFLSLGKMFFG